MKVQRNSSGVWLQIDTDPSLDELEGYSAQLISTLNQLEAIFSTAREACEFSFIWTLLGIRDMQDAGWDPYETTMRALSEVLSVSNATTNHVAQKHLQLWLYLHIIEASEPYEILSNLLSIVGGGSFNTNNFPPKKHDRLYSPKPKYSHSLCEIFNTL